MTYPVRRVDHRQREQVEPLGSKSKFWFREDQRRLLFKADDRGTGEDWAEVVACHMATLIGLPHVAYELAEEVDGVRVLHPGVICESMTLSSEELVLGNQLLPFINPNYPLGQRSKVREHTIQSVHGVVGLLDPPTARWLAGQPDGISTALDVFTGYAMFDVWIANQDRHHENWGALSENAPAGPICLAPSFDHGAALARNLRDSERMDRLSTRDKNRSVEAFAARARGRFYDESDSKSALPLLDTFQQFARFAPAAAAIWLEKLATVSENDVSAILTQVPSNRMSSVCLEFTLALVRINRQRLLTAGVLE
jgi:hypothetical protein